MTAFIIIVIIIITIIIMIIITQYPNYWGVGIVCVRVRHMEKGYNCSTW